MTGLEMSASEDSSDQEAYPPARAALTESEKVIAAPRETRHHGKRYEEENQGKNSEPQSGETGEPPRPRMPTTQPVDHATPSLAERSGSPGVKGSRTGRKPQVKLEYRDFLSGDSRDQGDTD